MSTATTDRTACINRIRGLLLEFGVAIAQGVRALELMLDDVLEDACNEMNLLARIALQRAQAQWRELDAHWRGATQFGAWLGLVPKQRSSGGKSHLGTITKRGDPYLRTLLVQGAKSVVNSAHTRSNPISRWVLALKLRSNWQKAVVALANKNARILWAVMTKGERFDRRHVSVKPASPVMTAPASALTPPAMAT